MRLILQCAVCGTINAVGLTECGTCRATGFENLRLLFECLHCFRVGLSPACEKCSKLLSLDPAYEIVPDPVDPNDLARRWGVIDDVAAAADKAAAEESLDADWEEELPLAELAPTSLEKKKAGGADVAAGEDDKSRRELPG